MLKAIKKKRSSYKSCLDNCKTCEVCHALFARTLNLLHCSAPALYVSNVQNMRRSHVIFLGTSIVFFTLALSSVSTFPALLVENAAFHIVQPSELAVIDLARNSSLPQLIPRIIHQTYSDTSILERWRLAQESCIKMHPDYEYKFWTDSDSCAFILKEYLWFLSTSVKHPDDIQRADAIRYFILTHYGRFYIDLDSGCRRCLDPSGNSLPGYISPNRLCDDGIGAAPGHHFFLYMID